MLKNTGKFGYTIIQKQFLPVAKILSITILL